MRKATRAQRRVETRYLDVIAKTIDDALEQVAKAKSQKRAR